MSKSGSKGTIDKYAKIEQLKGFERAIKDRDGKIFTDPIKSSHKSILIQIAKIKPSEEEFLRHELFKDNAGKYSPYIGFVNSRGDFFSREEIEKMEKENIDKPKSYAQLFHYSSVTDSIKRIAKNILDPDIKNPLPAIEKEAEALYQAFIDSKEGKAVYDSNESIKELPDRVERILGTLREKVRVLAKNDPHKFQLLNAYLRDKISEGLS